MQITLKQQHIETAIKAYVAKAGIAFPVEEINFTAGRGSAGMTATIDVEDPFALDTPDDAPQIDDTRPQASKPKAVANVSKVNDKPKALSKTAPEPVTENADPTPDPAADDTPPEATKTEEPPFTTDENEEAGEAAELPEPKPKASLFG